MKRARQPDPRIVDPQTHQQRWVNLTVAAEFLDMGRRALNAYVDEGKLTVELRSRRYKVHVDELVRFKAWRRQQRKAS